MKCEEIKEMLLNYMEKRLDKKEKEKIEYHLKICPDCSRILSDYKNLIKILKILPGKEIPEDLIHIINEIIEKSKEEIEQKNIFSYFMDFFKVPTARILVPVIAVLVILIVGIKHINKKKREITPPVITIQEEIRKIEIPIVQKKKEIIQTTTIIAQKLPQVKNDVKKMETTLVASAERVSDTGMEDILVRGAKPVIEKKIKERLIKELKTLNLNTIKIDSEIEEIFHRRAERLFSVQAMKKRGIIGEGNKGMLGIPREKENIILSKLDHKTIYDENIDRISLIQLYAKNLAGKSVVDISGRKMIKEKIRKVLVEVFQDMSLKGEFIQSSDGKWSRK